MNLDSAVFRPGKNACAKEAQRGDKMKIWAPKVSIEVLGAHIGGNICWLKKVHVGSAVTLAAMPWPYKHAISRGHRRGY